MPFLVYNIQMSINQDKLGFESNIASEPKDTIKNDKTTVKLFHNIQNTIFI